MTIMRECQCKDKGGRLQGKDNRKEDTSRRKEEGNSKEMEDKDSSWTCVVGLVDGGGTSLVVQLGEHSGKSYDNQTGVTETKIKTMGIRTRMMTGKIMRMTGGQTATGGG